MSTSDPFAGRAEITSEEYRAWLDQESQDGRNGSIVAPDASQPKRRGRDHSGALRGMRESAFRDAVVEYARRRGWLCYWTWNSKHSPAGWPDLFMLRKGRAVAAELKIRPNKPTTSQLAWLAALAENAGIETHVWYDDMWSEIERILA